MGASRLRFWGYGRGHALWDFARVCGAGEVLCAGGAQLHGDHLPTVLVPPDLDGLPPLPVVGSGWAPFDVNLEFLVFPRDAVPMGDLARGPYPRGGASGCCKLKGQLYLGTYSEHEV